MTVNDPIADISSQHPQRMVTVRFSNEHDRIELMVEPWATVIDIAPAKAAKLTE